jgi:hypothetical protein
MASIVDIQKLASSFESYYLDYGQNKNRLIRSLVQPSVTVEKHAIQRKIRETVYRMANYEYGSVIQPFTPNFTPISSIEFFPNEIQLQEMKVNMSITPHEIEDGYLGFMDGDQTKTMSTWPIVRWLIEEYVTPKIQEDRELKLVYTGKKVVGGTTPESCMDGIKQQLIKGTTSDYPINTITGIGTLNETTIFDQIEAFDKQIPDLYVNKPVTIYVAEKWERAFRQAQRDKGIYQINVNGANQIDTMIDFTNHKVVGLPSMIGTDDMWASINNNLLWLTKREGNLAQASIQLHHYNVDILLDWWEALGFACNKMVWATAETVSQTSGSGS